MTDIPTTEEVQAMTDEEYAAALAASIDDISDHDVRQALVNHSLILQSYDKILTTMAARQATVERILLTLMGNALPTPPKATDIPPIATSPEARPGQYL